MDKKPKAAGVPNTRLIDRKVTAFAPAGIAIDFISLTSLPYVFDSVAFWIKQLERMVCPSCGVVGSLSASIASYGILFECRRVDHGACDFLHEQLFSKRAD